MLILAGITIVYVWGDNGIFKKAQESKIVTEQSTVLEVMRLKIFEGKAEKLNNLDSLNYLKSEKYIDGDSVVDVSKITAPLSTGKGNLEDGDCYYILEGDLYYLSKDKIEKNLGKIFEDSQKTVELKWLYKLDDNGNAIITGIDESGFDRCKVGDMYGRLYAVKVDLGTNTLVIPSEIERKKGSRNYYVFRRYDVL